MIKVIKKYKWFLIVAAVPYVLYFLFMTITVPYYAFLPGDITPIEKVVMVDTPYENKGTYNSTSVISMTNITLFQKYVYGNLKDTFIVKMSEEEQEYSIADENRRGQIEHDSAIFSSLICAYKHAGINIDYKYKGMYVYYSNDASNMLQVGDVILGNNREEIESSVDNYNKDNGIIILRNNKEITIKPEKLPNFSLAYEFYELGTADVPYEVYASTSQGPSAGFMQALALYDDLMEEDYTNGLKIAGTGTIDLEGNVGAIGAVGLKIYTAYYNNVDIFFVPYANYEEANKVFSLLDTKMKMIVIDNFDDAINYLGELKND